MSVKQIRRIITIIMTITMTFCVSVTVRAESFFEYYFIPGEMESPASEATENFGQFLDELPEEIKANLPEEMKSGDLSSFADGAGKIADFSYVWGRITEKALDLFFPSIRSAASVIGLIVISAILKALKNSLGDGGIPDLAETVINVGVVITLIGTELVSFTVVEEFNEVICGLMNSMVPFLGVIYAASGNAGTAAVQSGGIMMLVTLCQNLFAGVILPSVRICLILSAAGAVFPEIGVKSVTNAFKSITTWLMVSVVTLFSFMLGLQNSIAQSADSFGIRSIKFAVGNLVPIIGGAVSDSLGTIGGSLELLKSAGGAAAIVIVIILIAPAILTLVIRRFVLFLCKNIAGVLGCTAEESLLGDMASVVSMMLAFSAAVSIAFIYTLTLFTGSALAISR